MKATYSHRKAGKEGRRRRPYSINGGESDPAEIQDIGGKTGGTRLSRANLAHGKLA